MERLFSDFILYNEHEEIYRTYYQLETAEKKQEYVHQLYEIPEYRNQVLLPGLFREEDFARLTEESIFNRPERSVHMQKHNRFTPPYQHQHSFFELVYVYSGSARHSVQGHEDLMTQGDLIIIAPETVHSLQVNDDSIILDGLIRKSTFQDRFYEFLKDYNILSAFFLSDLYRKKSYPYILFQTGKNERLEKQLFDLFLEQKVNDGFTDSLLNQLLMVFFGNLVRYHQHKVFLPGKTLKKEERILKILNYLQGNYNHVTLTEAADYFHFTPAYFSAYVREHTGATFSTVIQELKLERAKDLLMHTNLGMAEICEQIGYANPPHFIRLFKKRYQVTPVQFRRMNS